MKFRSPRNTPVRVASTTGHIAIVGPEFKELPQALHEEAMRVGCICDQETVQVVDPTKDPYPNAPGQGAVQTGGERAIIKAALKSMLLDRMESPNLRGENDEDPRFTPDGLPRTEYVSKIAAITAEKTDVLSAWDELRSEALTAPKPTKTGAEKARAAASKAAAAPKAAAA